MTAHQRLVAAMSALGAAIAARVVLRVAHSDASRAAFALGQSWPEQEALAKAIVQTSAAIENLERRTRSLLLARTRAKKGTRK